MLAPNPFSESTDDVMTYTLPSELGVITVSPLSAVGSRNVALPGDFSRFFTNCVHTSNASYFLSLPELDAPAVPHAASSPTSPTVNIALIRIPFASVIRPVARRQPPHVLAQQQPQLESSHISTVLASRYFCNCFRRRVACMRETFHTVASLMAFRSCLLASISHWR